MRSLPLLGVLLLCGLRSEEVELRVTVAEGDETRVDARTEVELEVGVLTLVRDGVRSPYTERQPRPLHGSTLRRYTDRVLAADANGAHVVERTFVEIRGGLGDLVEEDEHEGVLEGRTVTLEAGAPGATRLGDDGPAVDERYLQGHRPEPPEIALLPAQPVESGATWHVPAVAAVDVLGLDPDVDWFAERPGQISLGVAALVAKALEGDVAVTWAETLRDGESELARLAFEFELTGERVPTSLAEVFELEEERETAPGERIEVDLRLAGAGEMLLDRTAGAVLSSTTEAHATVLAVMRGDASNDRLELGLAVDIRAERTYAR